MTLFPFADYWWFYGLFLLFVLIMLALDLGIFNRKVQAVSFKQATIWSIVWIALALIFNYLFYQYSLDKFGAEIAQRLALEFLSGYVVEYSLSIDNIFVFYSLGFILGVIGLSVIASLIFSKSKEI